MVVIRRSFSALYAAKTPRAPTGKPAAAIRGEGESMKSAATRATAPTPASGRSLAFLGRWFMRFSVPLLIISLATLPCRSAGGVWERPSESSQRRAPRPVDQGFPGAFYGASGPIPANGTVVLDGYRGAYLHLYSLVPISVNAKYCLRRENATICHPAIPHLPGGYFRAEPRGTNLTAEDLV